jgi:hypothetical protein
MNPKKALERGEQTMDFITVLSLQLSLHHRGRGEHFCTETPSS